MPSKILSLELHGLDGILVEIECDRRGGIPKFIIVGLPDTAVQEARERVKSAIRNSDFEFPRSVVVVNLAPADLKKSGPRHDLPMALGILSLTGEVKLEPKKWVAIGELALNGQVRPVNGILASVQAAKQAGLEAILVPKENAAEASLVPGIKVLPVGHLREAVQYAKKKLEAIPIHSKPEISKKSVAVDMASIKGQLTAKRALEIAAAGGHNLIFCGAPGAGKTLMAKALAGILPSMTLDEMMEVTKIYSVAGLLPKHQPLITDRPFRVVHHTASGMSIVGGGNIPGPGEVSLAHRGVLFMDEIAEFPKNVLEVLRQPMEDRSITVSRVKGTYTYPCQFTLVAAMNPCPCGFRNVENAKQECTCNALDLRKYEKRLSGPLLDRFDMFVGINPIAHADLQKGVGQEGSESIRARVEKSVVIQRSRFKDLSVKCNAEMRNGDTEAFCKLDKPSHDLLGSAMDQMNLSARAYFRILKVARTIADLREAEVISQMDIAEALQFRMRM